MAYWNGEKIVYWEDKKSFKVGWIEVDCGCCVGIEWSAGYIAKECRRCAGLGMVFKHKKSGVFAQYPGGPFC